MINSMVLKVMILSTVEMVTTDSMEETVTTP